MRLPVVLAAALAFAPTAVAHTDTTSLRLEWPAQGIVTAGFGRDDARWHPGIDIGTLRSLDITAAAPGRVLRVGEQTGYEGYGNVVEVDVGGGFTLLYAHLADEAVHRGDWVVAGERLGTAGCTGWCTGTHLHFELRHRGVAADPSLLLG